MASEECDGVRNDCVYDSSGIPTNEIDYDNDKYVECGFDGGTWRGASAPLIGVDCSPEDANTYPNAPVFVMDSIMIALLG